MADVKVEAPSYEKLAHLAKVTNPADPNFRNIMREKQEAFQRDVRAPKLAERKKAKQAAQADWLRGQTPEVQKSFNKPAEAKK